MGIPDLVRRKTTEGLRQEVLGMLSEQVDRNLPLALGLSRGVLGVWMGEHDSEANILGRGYWP